MLVNCVQPASRIDRFRPALAATLRPGCLMVPAAEAVMAATRRSSNARVSQVSTSPRATLWWKSRRWLRSVRHSLASDRLSRLRLPGPGTHDTALQVDDPLLRGVEESRVGNDLSVAGGQEPRHSYVDTDRPARRRQRRRLGLGDDEHVPAATLPLELQGLHPANHRPVLVHPDSPDRLEGRVRPPATVSGLPFGAVPSDEENLVEALPRLEAWVADRPLLEVLALHPSLPPGPLGAPHALEIGPEHHIEATEGLLLGGKGMAALPVRVGGADLLELGRLVTVGDAEVAHAPGLAALLEGGVVEIAVVGQQPHRPALLRTGGIGAELVGAFHGQPFRWREVRSEAMSTVNNDRGTILLSWRRPSFRQRRQAVPLGGC